MKSPTLPVLLVCLVPLCTARADDWPQWRGPDRTDISKEKGLLRSWPKGGPKLNWTFEGAGVGYSGFAIVGKRLYTMGAFGEKEAVLAIDVDAGKKAWSTEVATLLTNGYG